MRIKAGMVVAIDLGDGLVAYGRVVDPPLFEFFDRFESSDSATPNVELNDGSPVLFRIWVMDSALKSGRWKVIGTSPIRERPHEYFFKKDTLTGRLTRYWEDRSTGEYFEVPASLEECSKLERAAVWDASHVEDRLRDHVYGRPNRWVDSLRP